MASSNITIVPAAEEDAPSLATIITLAFTASDAAYPLIWTAQAAEGVHDNVAIKGIFTPVQRPFRVTYKAKEGDRIVGFATWSLPDVDAPKKSARVEAEGSVKKSTGIPEIPGVDLALWHLKQKHSQEAAKRDGELSEDMSLSLLSVHPDHQRKGVGALLLHKVVESPEELKAKIWLTSTPQAIRTYEKSGWKVVQKFDIDLAKYGGSGTYSRAWMVRLPSKNIELRTASYYSYWEDRDCV